jgi:hypothetical protein
MAPYNPVNSAYRPNRPNQPVFAVRPNPVYNQPNRPQQPQSQQQPQPQQQTQQQSALKLQNFRLDPPPPPTQTTHQTTSTTQHTNSPQIIVGGEQAHYARQRVLLGGMIQNPDVAGEPGQYMYLDEDEEARLRALQDGMPLSSQPQTTLPVQQINELNLLVQSGLKQACNLSTTSVFEKNKYPWIVSIGSISEKHIKTGVLIHPRWVLTVQDYMNIGLKNYIVKIGGVNLDNNSEFTIQSVINDVIHPDNRIQLLQLNSDVVGIQPIQINMDKSIKPPAIELGWGTLSGSNATKTLHEMNIPILNPEICKVVFQNKFKDELNICGGYPECQNLIPCIGDTGDPLIFLNDNNKYVLEAISEYHLNCEVRSGLGSWIKISKLVPWILQYIPDLMQIRMPTLAPTITPSPLPTIAPSPLPTIAPSPLPTIAPSPLSTIAPSPSITLPPNVDVQALLSLLNTGKPRSLESEQQDKQSSFKLPSFKFDGRYLIITFIIILFTLFFVLMIMNLSR